ncbi:MAG: pyruvate/2-oxoglutarate dehydrogenase complex, dehydrogenase (E1) component, beta subunit [uncultured archaeon A07HR60]|nr:MAG: pyruvate/2-oxoglutarate dehydrogenase complex, dehydrogenase (E1) component, beta subunit [uncultured archaeon A07HR60]
MSESDHSLDSQTDTDDDAATQRLTLVEAVRHGLDTALTHDDDVVVLGQDIGKKGGVLGATEGLWETHGDDRVIDTPLAESGIVGTAVGMAAMGMRPVPEIQFSGYSYPGYDQIVSHMSQFRTRSRGEFTLPMTLRAPYGGGTRAPEHHSDSKEAFFAHEAGLKVAIPSTPYDTKGLLLSAIQDPDPVVFLEPKLIYRAFRGDVPEGEYTVPLGEARSRRQGTDVAVFTYGAMTQPTLTAAETLAEKDGIDCEVVDLRTISPLDRETIVDALKKCGRAVVVHEAPKSVGLGGEIIATLQERSLPYQEAPVKRVTGFDTPVPLHALEDFYLPNETRVKDAVREVIDF